MRDINVVCRNEEELLKITEIAEKEGYQWFGDATLQELKPSGKRYPYEILFRKVLTYSCFAKEGSCSAEDFINSYNTYHAEPREVSQKVKNEIILDFMKKWHEIRMGCYARECHNCKFRGDEYGDTSCNLDDVDDTADEETFLEAVNLLIDVVASGDARILQLTPNDAAEILRKEIETLNGREDDEARGHMEALKMAVRALEEKENGFRTKGDRTYQIGV